MALSLVHNRLEVPMFSEFDAGAQCALREFGAILLNNADLFLDPVFDIHDQATYEGEWKRNTKETAQQTAQLNYNAPAMTAINALDEHLTEYAPSLFENAQTREIFGLRIDENATLHKHIDHPDIIGPVRIIIPRARNAGRYTLQLWERGSGTKARNAKPAASRELSTDEPLALLIDGNRPDWSTNLRSRMATPHAIVNQSEHPRISISAYNIQD